MNKNMFFETRDAEYLFLWDSDSRVRKFRTPHSVLVVKKTWTPTPGPKSLTLGLVV